MRLQPSEASRADGPSAAITFLPAHRSPADREAAVLLHRIAATLAQREPGWRLPRATVLAKRYGVTAAEIAAAIDELAARHLVRLLPDGQACKTSPAHYVLPLGTRDGLQAHAEPAGPELAVASRNVSWHPARDDIERAIGAAPGESICHVQLLWAISGEPAAFSTTYVAGWLAKRLVDDLDAPDPGLASSVLPLTGILPPEQACTGWAAWLEPQALQVDLQQLPPWLARPLGLSACQQGILSTVQYRQRSTGRPAGLSVAALRPDLFRLVIGTADRLLSARNGALSWWQHAAGDWDF